MPEDKPQRIIKRYANRKLYDMSESCYITHDEIADLVSRGEDITIIDNRTKEDLTSATLTQILFDKERKTKRSLPVATLRTLFEQSGDFIQQHIAQPLTNFRDEAEKNVRKVFKKVPERGVESRDEPRDLGRERPKAADALKDWANTTQQAYETLQRTIEERLSMVLGKIGELDHSRVAELERRVASLEAELGKLRADQDATR